MTLYSNETIKEAHRLWLMVRSVPAVAEKMNIPHSTVLRWKKRDFRPNILPFGQTHKAAVFVMWKRGATLQQCADKFGICVATAHKLVMLSATRADYRVRSDFLSQQREEEKASLAAKKAARNLETAIRRKRIVLPVGSYHDGASP